LGTFVGHQGHWPKRRPRYAAALRNAPDRRRIEFLLRWLLLASVGLFIALVLYYPALEGGFVLDDLSLPLGVTHGRSALTNLASSTRPILMLSYGLNALLFGAEPASYRIVNVGIHVLNACLVFLVLKRLLEQSGWSERARRVASCCGALVFLAHPLQTESVSYIAGRSESLASLFLLLAYAVYLYTAGDAISWRRAFTVIALFAIAVKTKENAVSLAGILLLTDVMGPKGSVLDGPRRNWRLYALMLPGAALAAIGVFRMLGSAQTAGFAVAKYTWYQYAFTEARAIFAYIRLAAAPFGQALDHDFATSLTITEHGAALYLALLALLVGAAIRYRTRYPLACFGFLMFLAWLAPTSSVVPVDDALVERRMYLPLLGLILIASDGARRIRVPGPAKLAAASAILLTFAGLCHARNRLWANPDLLIAQSAESARHNPRPLLNIAEVLIRRERCELALPYLDRADRMLPNSYFVHSIRGRALACLGRSAEAIAHFQVAAKLRPCSEIYQWMGLLYGRTGRLMEAGASLRKAVELAPQSAAAHSALALWHEAAGDLAAAEREYVQTLKLDPYDAGARAALERVRTARQLPPASD
jgi:Flp pilus assembly protein TadD